MIRNGALVPDYSREVDDSDTEPIWLYRWYDQEGNLLYLGLTNNPERRVAGQRSRAEWWPWAARVEFSPEPIVGRCMAERLEGQAIMTERPIFNCDWSPMSRDVAEHYMEIAPKYDPPMPEFPPGLKPGQVWLTPAEWAEFDSMLTLGRVSKAVQLRAILREAVTEYLAKIKESPRADRD